MTVPFNSREAEDRQRQLARMAETRRLIQQYDNLLNLPDRAAAPTPGYIPTATPYGTVGPNYLNEELLCLLG